MDSHRITQTIICPASKLITESPEYTMIRNLPALRHAVKQLPGTFIPIPFRSVNDQFHLSSITRDYFLFVVFENQILVGFFQEESGFG